MRLRGKTRERQPGARGDYMRTVPLKFRFAVLIALALAAAIGAVLLRFHRPLPRVSGDLVVDGLSAPVEILRDRYGIPHVRAATRLDAVFALGFLHAQDRLWQMEIQRRAATGRLSEALGPAALPTDRFMRTIGFARAASEARSRLDAPTVETIDAYARGVNAFLSRTSGWRLPIEYALTGITAEPWTPDDVVAAMKLLAWMQGLNWREELLRLRLAAKVGPDRAVDLVPAETEGVTVLPEVSPEAAGAVEQITRLLEQIDPRSPQTIVPPLAFGESAAGSNAWVLGGSRTASGRPILANDPHIAAQAPSTWYLVHLTGGTLDVIGASFPGACAIAIGHNAHVAWGVTNAMADAQDLFAVGYQEPTTTIEEVIRIKGGGEERLTVRVTSTGPIISDVAGHGGALALKWTGLDPADATISAFIALNEATDTTTLRAALARMHAPVLGIVYASTTGEIGYSASGVVPERGPTGAWSALHQSAAVASAIDPDRAFIVTANNAIGGAAPPLSTSFDPPYRAARITALVEAESALSLEDVARIQLDTVSTQPRVLAPLLFDRAEPVDERAAAALRLLKQWDGGMHVGSAGAALYQRYYAEAAQALFRDELGETMWREYRGATAALARAMDGLARRGADAWCDDVELPGTQSCGQILGGALTLALESLEREQGSHMAAWRLDAGNVVRFPHAPMDAVALLRPLFSRELHRPGDAFTVNPSMRIRDQTLVASYRQIIDVGDWDNSRFVIPMGQSGHPISGHYDDLLPLWDAGHYVPMAFSEGAVRAAAWNALTLRPRQQAPSSTAYIPRGN